MLEQFDPRRGGLEQWTLGFAGRLIELGHEVHVVARRFDRRARSMPIVAHPLQQVGPRSAFAEAAQAKLLSIAPEVIHDMGSGWYCDVFHPHGGSWVSLTERKLALHPRWLRPLKRRLDKLLRRHREFKVLTSRQYADNGQIMVALSQGVAEDFVRLHGVPPGRIRVVYNGVDTDRFSPAGRHQHRPAVRRELGIDQHTVLALIVAHNFRLKGVHTLLRAMRRLKAAGRAMHLAVVGGKRLGGWRRMARRLGVETMVRFLGPKDETIPYYAAADFYVHPTFYDTCSLVVLEAAASGLPIITTRLNGVAELFRDGLEGLLLSDPSDACELARRMETLQDESLRRRMGAAGRRMALEHTLKRNVDEIVEIYEEIAPGRRRPAARRTLRSHAERGNEK